MTELRLVEDTDIHAKQKAFSGQETSAAPEITETDEDVIVVSGQAKVGLAAERNSGALPPKPNLDEITRVIQDSGEAFDHAISVIRSQGNVAPDDLLDAMKLNFDALAAVAQTAVKSL